MSASAAAEQGRACVLFQRPGGGALRAFLCSGRAGVAAVFLALRLFARRLRPGTGGRHFFGGKGRGGVPFRFTGVSFLPMGRKGLLFPPGVV